MEQLYEDIDDVLHSMKDIIANIGSKKDTIQSRRQFAILQVEVNRKLMKAARDNIDLSLDNKYVIQVQTKTDSLRIIIENAIKQFSKYTPNNNDNNNRNCYNLNEKTPLLSFDNNLSLTNLSSSSPVDIDIDDYIQNDINHDIDLNNIESIKSIQSMQNVFDALYGVIREQEQELMINNNNNNNNNYIINPNDNNIETDHYIPFSIRAQRIQQRRDQRNMIVGLILCLLVCHLL